MQCLKPAKEFGALIANEESLNALLGVKEHITDYLPDDAKGDKKTADYLWQAVLWAVWGTKSENGGGKVIKTTPDELREIYKQIFA